MREALEAKRGADVRAMFGRIAHRYDLLNRVLSIGQDRRWRRALVRRAAAARAGLVIDVCAGTGDVALGVAAQGPTLACDSCLPMLALARARGSSQPARPFLCAAEALCLPLADSSVDLVTVAFGVRNFEDLEGGLGELGRVLRPGGLLLVLEFSRPGGLLGPLLRWWVERVLPVLGRWLSGDDEAYSYLSETIGSFPSDAAFCGLLSRVGLDSVRSRSFSGGVVRLYEGVKAGM